MLNICTLAGDSGARYMQGGLSCAPACASASAYLRVNLEYLPSYVCALHNVCR